MSELHWDADRSAKAHDTATRLLDKAPPGINAYTLLLHPEPGHVDAARTRLANTIGSPRRRTAAAYQHGPVHTHAQPLPGDPEYVLIMGHLPAAAPIATLVNNVLNPALSHIEIAGPDGHPQPTQHRRPQ